MQVDIGPGAEFAGHRIERVIGRGGMSVVYLAEHLRLGRKVALKVLFPHLADDPGFRDRFIRESRTAAGLDHPNIVTVYDAGEVSGLLYLSMRYVEGSDLGRVLQDGAADPWRTIAIVSQIASALDAAHAEGLVHRDVKPANILLSSPGTAIERAFLSDFGITKRMTTSEALTRTGQFVGTVDFVAPEQIRGAPVDGRTDVYSLGCVLYQCLSGTSPFPRPTDVATIYAHLNDEPPSASVDLPGMDPVIARALAKEKEDRYPTCSALAEAARSQLQSGDATDVVTFSETAELDQPTEPRRGRSRVPLVVAAVLAVVVASSFAFANWRGDGGERATQSPSSSPPSSGGPTSTAPPPRNAMETNWSKYPMAQETEGGQVVITAATTARGDAIVAGGHADRAITEDQEDENAAVWIRENDAVWSRRNLPGGSDPDDNERIWDVASIGDVVVGVGYEDDAAAAWFSNDAGNTWERASVPPAESRKQGMNAVVVAPGRSGLIAFGRDRDAQDDGLGVGAMWTSEDGTTWSRQEVPAFEVTDGAYISGAATDGGTIIAVGRATGPDGSDDAAVWEFGQGTWKQVDPAQFEATGVQGMLEVTQLDGATVAVGEGVGQGFVWVRTQGQDWSRARVNRNGQPSSASAVTIVDDRTFVVVGWAMNAEGDQDAAVWFSEDAINWERQPPGTDLTVGLAAPPGNFQSMRAVLSDGGSQKIYAFGEDATTAAHTDSNAQVWIRCIPVSARQN